MNHEEKRATSAPKKPAKSRKRGMARAAAMTPGKTAAVSVPIVPTVPLASARSRSTLVLPLGVLTTILTLVVGAVAWFSDSPMPFGEDRSQALGAVSAPVDQQSPHGSGSMEQELRLATLALDIRETQESILHLSENARTLAASVEALASGIDHLKSDLGAARTDVATARARLEEGLHEVRTSVAAEPLLLGDPALRTLTLPVSGDMRATSNAGASESVEPATTGVLPEVSRPPEATVTGAFNDRKPAPRRKPIKGWRVNYADAELAVVSRKDVSYRVRAGHILPGPGTVQTIKKRGDQWVVLTSKGVISEGR